MENTWKACPCLLPNRFFDLLDDATWNGEISSRYVRNLEESKVFLTLSMTFIWEIGCLRVTGLSHSFQYIMISFITFIGIFLLILLSVAEKLMFKLLESCTPKLHLCVFPLVSNSNWMCICMLKWVIYPVACLKGEQKVRRPWWAPSCLSVVFVKVAKRNRQSRVVSLNLEPWRTICIICMYL